jgi:hypothetical protein
MGSIISPPLLAGSEACCIGESVVADGWGILTRGNGLGDVVAAVGCETSEGNCSPRVGVIDDTIDGAWGISVTSLSTGDMLADVFESLKDVSVTSPSRGPS